MKKIMITMAMMLTIAVSANAINSRQARFEAQQMTEHMSRQLGLNPRQSARVYDINYDYMKHVGTRHEAEARNHRMARLERVLSPEQLRRMHAGTMHRPESPSWRQPASRHHGNRRHDMHNHY